MVTATMRKVVMLFMALEVLDLSLLVMALIQRSVDMSPPLMGLLVVNIEGGS